MRFAITFIMFAFCISCVKVDEVPSLPAYSVYSIISPEDSLISVFVGNAYSIGERFPIDSGKYFPNAQVKITNRDESLFLRLNPKTKSYEADNRGFVKHGINYELEVLVENKIFLGETRVPERKNLKVDSSFVEDSQGNIRVSWNTSNFSESYYRLIGTVDFDAPLFPFFYWDSDFSLWETRDQYVNGNRIISPQGNFKFTEPYTEGIVTITLESLDINWGKFKAVLDAENTRTEFSRKFEAPLYFESNITNALGVFGSNTKTEIHLILTK